MPPKLTKAHQALDRAVDLRYRPQAFTNENARIEYLFDLYSQYTAPLLNERRKDKVMDNNNQTTINEYPLYLRV